ncbi:MAG: 50S ribosomal protein L17 [Parcubacteria group bacterium GW2011_GWA2_47_7]|nr:MAG: 50S ribosomal protein L17 [Parcubacteria group bacterium GW2011_GWA2_47_7]
MRHHNKNKKFGRQAGTREALMRSLVLSLLTHEKIMTTEAKAKALRPVVEKMITKAMAGDIPAVRIIKSRLYNNADIASKLVKDIAPRYKERKGGYTRITKIGFRSGRGDASPLATIELI